MARSGLQKKEFILAQGSRVRVHDTRGGVAMVSGGHVFSCKHKQREQGYKLPKPTLRMELLKQGSTP